MSSSTKHSLGLLTLAGLLLLPVMAVAQAQPLTIIHGPVVENVGSTRAEVAWATSTGGSSIVHYGTNPSSLSQTAQAPYDRSAITGQPVTHRVTINGLQPNTTYYFVVDSGQGQGTGSEAKSQMGQFMTTARGGDKVPLYRALSPTDGSHLFTRSYPELQKAIASGWKDEGIAGYMEATQVPGTEPLYHLFNAGADDHFYTVDASERVRANTEGYRDEGVAGYLFTNQQPGSVPFYRLYDPQTKKHFYTANPAERQTNLQRGWRDEGISGYISQR